MSADREGTRQLLRALAEAAPMNQQPLQFLDKFDKWWSDLEKELEQIRLLTFESEEKQPPTVTIACPPQIYSHEHVVFGRHVPESLDY